jgi:hypothetical protein
VPRSLRFFTLTLIAALFALRSAPIHAQSIAPPRASVVRMAAPADLAATDSVRHTGWTQSKGAVAGGMIGVVAGLLGAFALRRDVYSSSGLYLKGATLFGALGVVLGSLAGAEAEGK